MNDERPIRWNMLICGTVQRVGFRHITQGIARKHHITGCIRNLEGYDVQIIAEGHPEDLNHFKDEIQIQEYPISVERIDVSEAPFTGEYSYFKITRGSPDEELAERFDSAIAIFSRMEKKQDIAINLGRETISLQKESLSLQNETLGLQKKTLSQQNETLHEVIGIRQDLNKILTHEIAEVKEELREIRSALIQAGIMKLAHS